jgi:hypothetical protein
MHNVSVGDIFTDSNEVYRVVEVLHSEDFPDDPYLVVESFVSGSGFERDEIGFSLLQAEYHSLQHYKAKAKACEGGSVSFAGPAAARWKEIYQMSPPPAGVKLID